MNLEEVNELLCGGNFFFLILCFSLVRGDFLNLIFILY